MTTKRPVSPAVVVRLAKDSPACHIVVTLRPAPKCDCDKLIAGLLLLAARCLETVTSLTPAYREQMGNILAETMPTKTITEAWAVASAGNLALTYLKVGLKPRVSIAKACSTALRHWCTRLVFGQAYGEGPFTSRQLAKIGRLLRRTSTAVRCRPGSGDDRLGGQYIGLSFMLRYSALGDLFGKFHEMELPLVTGFAFGDETRLKKRRQLVKSFPCTSQ